MYFMKTLLRALNAKELKALIAAFVLFCAASVARAALTVAERSVFVPVAGGSYQEGIVGQPVAVNPVISSNAVDQDISALVYSALYDLAANDSVEEGGRVFTVNLKEGLKWSDGTPLTSDDVVFTVHTVQDHTARSPLFKNWQGVTAERVSELQVRFSLPAPYAFFPENVKRLPIIPKHIFGSIPPANLSLSAYNLSPVGSGPYRFDTFNQRKDGFITEYRLVPNEHYSGEKPYIQEFSFFFFEDEEKLLSAFRLHKIDGFGTTTPSESLRVFSQAEIEHVPMFRYYAVFFNQNNNPVLKNDTIRRALVLATPREKIVREVFGGNAVAISGPVFSPVSGKNDFGTYDPDTAKFLIQKEKLGTITLNLTVPDIPFMEKTAGILKQSWEETGIGTVRIVTMDPKDVLNLAIKSNNYEMLLFGNILENKDDLYPFWHSSQRMYPGLNLAVYKNDRADTLMESIRQTMDPKAIPDLLDSLNATIVKDYPADFLYSVPYVYIHYPVLKGFSVKGSNGAIASPSERFDNAANWFVTTARIIK